MADKQLTYQQVLEIFRENADALARWAAETVAYLGAREEWSMEDNFGATESLVALSARFRDLPSAGDQTAEGLAFWRTVAKEIDLWDADEEGGEDDE